MTTNSPDKPFNEKTPKSDASEKAPAGQWGDPHKAVVFIHGVGSQERGDTLMDFVSPLVNWARGHKTANEESKWSSSVNPPDLISYPREGQNRAFVRMKFGDEHRIELTEALWADAFRPLPSDLLIRWSLVFLTRMGFSNLFRYLGRVFKPWTIDAVPPIWLFEWLHSLLLVFVFPVVLVLGYAVIGVLWLTDIVPLPNVIPNTVAGALRAISQFLTGSLGDIAVYMQDPAKRDAIRQVLEDILDDYENNESCSGKSKASSFS